MSHLYFINEYPRIEKLCSICKERLNDFNPQSPYIDTEEFNKKLTDGLNKLMPLVNEIWNTGIFAFLLTDKLRSVSNIYSEINKIYIDIDKRWNNIYDIAVKNDDQVIFRYYDIIGNFHTLFWVAQDIHNKTKPFFEKFQMYIDAVTINGLCEKIKKEKEKEIEELHKENDNLRKENDRLCKENDRLAKFKEIIEENDKLRKENEELHKDNKYLTIRCSDLHKENFQNSIRIEKCHKKNKELNTKNEELNVKINRIRERSEERGIKVLELRHANEDLDVKVKELDSKVKELNDSNEVLNAKVKELDSKVKELESTNKELDSKVKELNSKAKRLSSRVDDLRRLNDAYSSDKEKLHEEIDKLNESNQKLCAKNEKLEDSCAKAGQEKIRRWRGLHEAYDNLIKERKVLKQQLEMTTNEISIIADKHYVNTDEFCIIHGDYLDTIKRCAVLKAKLDEIGKKDK